MGFYTMALMGMAPFGSLLYGAVADRIGVPYTMAGGGMICVAGALCCEYWRPVVRRLARKVFVQKGIIPEIATDIEMGSAKK